MPCAPCAPNWTPTPYYSKYPDLATPASSRSYLPNSFLSKSALSRPSNPSNHSNRSNPSNFYLSESQWHRHCQKRPVATTKHWVHPTIPPSHPFVCKWFAATPKRRDVEERLRTSNFVPLHPQRVLCKLLVSNRPHAPEVRENAMWIRFDFQTFRNVSSLAPEQVQFLVPVASDPETKWSKTVPTPLTGRDQETNLNDNLMHGPRVWESLYSLTSFFVLYLASPAIPLHTIADLGVWCWSFPAKAVQGCNRSLCSEADRMMKPTQLGAGKMFLHWKGVHLRVSKKTFAMHALK